MVEGLKPAARPPCSPISLEVSETLSTREMGAGPQAPPPQGGLKRARRGQNRATSNSAKRAARDAHRWRGRAAQARKVECWGKIRICYEVTRGLALTMTGHSF